MKKFYIKTFGCQMNVYDGQRINAMLRSRGLTQTDDLSVADLIVLNTCAVREKASNKVFSELGRIRDHKKPDALFGIVGCVAKEEGANSFRRMPELNFVLGPQSYHKLPEILENPDARLLNIDLSGLEKFDSLPPISESSVLAYIPIQEGCDHCCTYCIVPFTRGREISRPFDDVMRDVYAAAENGAIEICFLGQNVNGYKFTRDIETDTNEVCAPSPLRGGPPSQSLATGGRGEGLINQEFNEPSPLPPLRKGEGNTPNTLTLADLIHATAQIKSIKRIRFTSSYPTEMTDDLIEMFAREPKLLPFLNMPIQSGSSNVLTRMNRPYSLDLYLDIINKLRAARPDIQISSDFIVGFPGETDMDFEQTMEIARRVKYINSYSFKYSPRPHTAAALMTDHIPENIKKQRLATLDGLLTEINREFNESCIGKTMECLIEGPDKTGKHLLARSPYMQQVIIPNESDDKIQTIEITAANKCSLRGKLV